MTLHSPALGVTNPNRKRKLNSDICITSDLNSTTSSTGQGSRTESSLGSLSKKFLNLIRQSPDGLVDLNQAAIQLGVAKRRIYDITNVMEGIGTLDKVGKNSVKYRFDIVKCVNRGVNNEELPEEQENELKRFQQRIKELQEEESFLDDQKFLIERSFSTQEFNDDYKNRLAFVTHSDIRSIDCFSKDTLFAVKAPKGCSLEVPDPDVKEEFPGHRKIRNSSLQSR
ncbi:hypothetical protein ROZALSC1DRAFT_27267 [Rozella allomycis CSF55]|uniref:E2F Family domain-containing protein n=1 Tax=Rozella allomycis (strain CSF55) TaxID=988480 RepID=A0A075AZT6_ROZAC|nr:E2F Family domain-containing protein [Rozella allomycis CSF55]RKP21315.1 hypothetical protein ROZALSC1DRAFT_27267 [Rozella allomycis CSF55]|eukprot:EPZ35609.1 E2F Family domain-containing protein [Rozella allomycis CSF55]